MSDTFTSKLDEILEQFFYWQIFDRPVDEDYVKQARQAIRELCGAEALAVIGEDEKPEIELKYVGNMMASVEVNGRKRIARNKLRAEQREAVRQRFGVGE